MELQVKFHSKMPLTSNVIGKRNFQKILKPFRESGVTVSKVGSDYTAHNGRVLVLKGMCGPNGYLVKALVGLIE